MSEEDEIEVGDYIFRIWPSGHETIGKAVKPYFYSEDEEFAFLALEDYHKEGGVDCGVHFGAGDYSYRKATDKELILHKLS